MPEHLYVVQIGISMAFDLPQVTSPVSVASCEHAGLGFRQARPFNAAAILDHLTALSPEARRMRFCGGVSDAVLKAHVAGLWRPEIFTLTAHEGPRLAGPVRAVAELAVDGSTAELGLSVDAGWRRAGVGTRLLQFSAGVLAWRGVSEIVAVTLPGNLSMLGLGRRCGAWVERGADEVVLRFSVEALHRAYIARRLADRVVAPLDWARSA